MDSNSHKLGYTFRVCFVGISMAQAEPKWERLAPSRPFAGTVKKINHSLKHYKFGNRNSPVWGTSGFVILPVVYHGLSWFIVIL